LFFGHGEVGLLSVCPQNAEQFGHHRPVNTLHVLTDESGKRFTDFRRLGVLLMLHGFGE
jgi:hypothetical protein